MSSPSVSTATEKTATAESTLRLRGTPLPRGRFAPSPTGPLHAGSLVAAVGSYLQIRSVGGEWLVRIEDLDPVREMPGAADRILRCLECFGFEWDGPVIYQSDRLEAFQEALEQLDRLGVIYPCTCSRKRLRALSAAQVTVYPGTCRGRRRRPPSAALRILTNPEPIGFEDLLQGPYQQVLERDVGDFIVRRRDGHYAYQLAVVVDDHAQAVTEIVRGCDLLDNTPRQIYLQRLLGVPSPQYAHLPLVLTAAGEKLSKQTGARPLDPACPVPQLWSALEFLGQQPPASLRHGDLATLWDWAKRHWRPEHIRRSSPAGRSTARRALEKIE